MKNYIYGVLNTNNEHIDISNTLLGAKQYATRHGIDRISKRNLVSWAVIPVARKILNNWVAENSITIYDNGGKSYDRITVVFNAQTIDGKMFDCLSCSEKGFGFFQHSTCMKGRHLGKQVKLENLHLDLQRKLNGYFNN